MSGFRPTRASPPARRVLQTEAAPISDISRTSAVSSSELQGLTAQDVEFLDAVIQRASPSATTFLTVFKAYNDILNERGMDPQNEVVYYGKLLKLGTTKGGSWGDKWTTVRMQQGHGGERTTVSRRERSPSPLPLARINAHYAPKNREDDLFTVHSHQDETESLLLHSKTETEADPHKSELRRPLSATASVASSKLGLRNRHRRAAPPAPVHQILLPSARTVRPWDETSDITDDARTPSTTPPSYKTVVQDATIYTPALTALRLKNRPLSAPGVRKSETLAPGSEPRERRKSMINEDDAWSKVKMLRDEKDADRFREDRLLESCWEVWKSGFDWINNTNEQISQARNMLLLRMSMQQWRNQTVSQLDLYNRVTTLANNRSLRAALVTWKSRMREKRQLEWRNSMRQKMKSVRERREGKLQKDIWAKWRQSYRSHLSGQHYNEHLLLRFYRQWKIRLLRLEHLEAVADNFAASTDGKAVIRCWTLWKKEVEMKNAELFVGDMVSRRVLIKAMVVWNNELHKHHAADAFHDHQLKRRTIAIWHKTQGHVKSLEKHADRHVAHRDFLILHAFWRIWKARERGRLLERVKTARVVKDAWLVWHRRIREQKQLEDVAVAFYTRSTSQRTSQAIQTWQQVYASHRNAYSFASQYYSAQLNFKMILTWRLQLRAKLRLMKQGRVAAKFFIIRRTWKLWLKKVEEVRRHKKLKELQKQKLRKYFNIWLDKALRKQHHQKSELHMQLQVALHIKQAMLSKWTNRVIALKLREIEVDQQIAALLIKSTFNKWKNICMRHVEELSLMQSYQDVKRDENIRRMFHRWLSAARSYRHRRLKLQEKEDEMEVVALAASWEKWRERFVNEKLRPIEYDVILQSQRNTLFRAFGIWQHKTQSLPAIQFHGSHAKAKFWYSWRAAMPKALQNRKARETYRRTVLAKFLEKWLQTYRTKMAIKAVARARYLRLPTSTPRPLALAAHPFAETPSMTRVPRRLANTESSVADASEGGPSRWTPSRTTTPAPRAGIASLLSSRPRSGTANSVLDVPIRNHSPTRTTSSRAPLETSPTRPTFRLQSRARGRRELSASPDRSKFSFSRAQDTEDEVMGKIAGPSTRSPLPSTAGGGEGRTSLWLELRDVQRKSRPSMERSLSKER